MTRLLSDTTQRVHDLIDSLDKFLACPARFERATYALEEFVAAQKSIYFNGLGQKISTV